MESQPQIHRSKEKNHHLWKSISDGAKFWGTRNPLGHHPHRLETGAGLITIQMVELPASRRRVPEDWSYCNSCESWIQKTIIFGLNDSFMFTSCQFISLFPEFSTYRSYRLSLSESRSPQSHPGIPAIAIEFVIRIVKLHNVPDFFENPERPIGEQHQKHSWGLLFSSSPVEQIPGISKYSFDMLITSPRQ